MRIVVLDDSKTVLLTIQMLLEELGVGEDFIYLFEDGYKALAHIEQNGADIIFSDINMPGMNGFEFVEKLLDVSTKFVSTLFVISADESGQTIGQMKQTGGRRFIRKPINAKHFNHFVLPEINKIKKRLNESTDTQKMVDVSAAEVGEYAIDYQKLAEQIGIKVKHIPRLISSFVEETKEIMEKLEDAVVYKYYEQIEKYAHSLKGSSGNMHFFDLSELCRVMELASRDEDKTFDYHHYKDEIAKELARIWL